MNNATQTNKLLAALVLAISSTANAQPASETQLTDKVEAQPHSDIETVRAPHGPRHLRMVVEGLAIQGIGTAWYWRHTGSGWGESNRVDWQLGFKGSALVKKLDGEGWRMDGNPYTINALCHPMSGSLTYYTRSEEHTSELQSRLHLVCRLLLENNKHSRFAIGRADVRTPATRRRRVHWRR